MAEHSQKFRIWTQKNLGSNLISTTSCYKIMSNYLDLLKPSAFLFLKDSRQGVSEIPVDEALHRNMFNKR